MGAKLPSTPQMVNDKQHTPRPHSSLIPPAASKRLAQTDTECPTPSAKTTLRPALLSSACCRPLLPPSARCHFRCFIKHRKRLVQTGNPTATYCNISPPTILRPLRPRHQNASSKLAPSARHAVPKQHSAPPLLSSACCSALGDRALGGVAVLPARPTLLSLRTFQPAFSGTDGGCRIRDGPGPRGLGAGRSGGGQMVCFSLWLLVSVVGVRRCCGVSRRLTRPIFSPAPTTEKK